MDSIGYYNKNSKEFFDRTINADLQKVYQKFLSYIPKEGRMLDAGCGVGRDSKFFLSKGYNVVPFDGSIEMVRMTKVALTLQTTLGSLWMSNVPPTSIKKRVPLDFSSLT